MKPEVTLKYLSYLRNKKNGEEGFTLIELLVVVIIIGVLAAVALPNLLGQVGKARETEAKNAVGSVNRAQQAYHFEKGTFTDDFTNSELQTQNALGTIIPASKYYTFTVDGSGGTLATIDAEGVSADVNTLNVTPATADVDNGAGQGTRDFTGGINFDGAGAYGQIMCQADVTGESVASVVNSALINGGTCADGDSLIK